MPPLFLRFSYPAPRLLLSLLCLLIVNSCKNNKTETSETKSVQYQRVEYLNHNNLGQAPNPTGFLLDQAHSEINWQPWSTQIFADAAKEKKTVMTFIGKSTDSHTLEILKKLNDSPSTCATINQSHVPVLIDADQYPDLTFFATTLNLSSKTLISNTQMVWFSYEGAPVSWISLADDSKVHETVTRTSKVVKHLWQEDPSYVLNNSRQDLARRIKNLTLPSTKSNENKDRYNDTHTIRQVASLYDNISFNIDNLSGLNPARYTHLMALAASRPDISDRQRRNYTEIAISTADNTLLKNLQDPLDGGIFTNNESLISALPKFTKTLWNQIYSMEALYSVYQLTSDRRYLNAANSIQHYVEHTLTHSDGGYSLGIIYANHNLTDNPCLWSLEEIEATLDQKELQLCTQAFGITGIGNIPISEDRNRRHFRKNTLSWKQSIQELATQRGTTIEELYPKIQTITKKLAKLRTEKTKELKKSKLITTSSTAALCSTYITAYRATGNSEHLEQARKILHFIRSELNSDSEKLLRCRFNGKTQSLPANAIDYTLVCRAALDMHEVTLEPQWLNWAAEIQQHMIITLGNGDFSNLLEAKNSSYPCALEIKQYLCINPINNPSTWAYAYINAHRLGIRGKAITAKEQSSQLQKGCTHLIQHRPLTAIDFLIGKSKLQQKIVYLKAPVSPELLRTASTGICQIIPVTKKGEYPGMTEPLTALMDGEAIVAKQGKVLGTAKTAEELKKLLNQSL